MSTVVPLTQCQFKVVAEHAADRYGITKVFQTKAESGDYAHLEHPPNLPIVFLGKAIGCVKGADGSIVRTPSNKVALEPDLSSDCYLEQIAWSQSISAEDSGQIHSLLNDASLNVRDLEVVSTAEMQALAILSKYFGVESNG